MAEITHFDDLWWHDSVLLNVGIDRTLPGKADTISIMVQWYDSERTETIIFENVFSATIKYNFGVIVGNGGEPILDAFSRDNNSQEVRDFKTMNPQWRNHVISFFFIEMNSTGSTISLFAQSFKIVHVH